MTPDAAFERYQTLRSRLPVTRFSGMAAAAPDLAALADRFDAFVFDAFGVLNVGAVAIAGAAARIAALRAAGVPVRVLTNAASTPHPAAVAKFGRLGFDFAPSEVISSRDVAARSLPALAQPALTQHTPGTWAAITAAGDPLTDMPADTMDLLDHGALWDCAEGFVFLSSDRWTDRLQERLVAAMHARPRPLVVANPDLVAPRGSGLSIEPGYWAHDLADRTGCRPAFHGKPFGPVFDAVMASLPARLDRRRVAMVGDTLHTDILGGAAAGLGTVLVTDHGVLAGRDVAAAIARAGIVPDFVVPSI